MKKKLLTERFQQLAGIKPLYTEQSDTDDYGRSISGKDKRTFMEPEDSMPAARAEKMLENQPTFLDDESMDEILDIILKYVEDPDDAYDELDRFEDGGFDALSNMVAANLDRDPEYKAWYNKLHSINENKVEISYTDPGFRFYRMKVDGKRLDREEGTEYLKGLGIDMEIPRSYNETTLDKIVAKLKEKGIDADHDAAMDVS